MQQLAQPANTQSQVIYSKGQPKMIGLIQIDSFDKEDFQRTAEVTQYPVGDSMTISDNMVLDPDEIQVNGVVGPVSLFDTQIGSSQRVINVYEELSKLMDAMQTVTLVTGLQVRSDVVISGFHVARDATSGQSLIFDMTFKQVVIVKSQSVTIPSAQLPGSQNADGSVNSTGAQAQGTQDKGNQQAKTVNAFMQGEIDGYQKSHGGTLPGL